MAELHFSHYLDPRLAVVLSTDDRDETLKLLVHHLYEAGKVIDEEIFLKAILQREKIVSTGIGMGVAIPHAKLPNYNQFFIALALLKKPVEWQSLDGAPVRIVFMIGGPDDKQTEYLQILSSLTRSIKDDETRKKLLTLQEPSAMIELFENI
jgi:PTS system nitrogen regulatory IIA component